jgi:hypothetical protein
LLAKLESANIDKEALKAAGAKNLEPALRDVFNGMPQLLQYSEGIIA